MPLERVNLAHPSPHAPSSATADKFAATPEELRIIQEKMQDPVFVGLMHDYMKSLEDPETRREEEAYLEQAEREAREGGDFSFEFVFPRPTYVVELLEPSSNEVTPAEARKAGVANVSATQRVRSFLNVCQSDKVTTFTERATGDCSGGYSNWEVPVSVSQRRVEVYNPLAASPSVPIPAEYRAAGSDQRHAPQLCIVHDVVFHPRTVELADRSRKFLCFLTEIAVEHVNSGCGESNGFPFRRLPSSVASIGTPQNQTLRTQKGTAPFAADLKEAVRRRPTKHLPNTPPQVAAPATKSTTAAAEGKHQKEEQTAAAPQDAVVASTAPTDTLPPHTITHRGFIDFSDAWQWKVSEKRVGVPGELLVRLTFAEVRRAAALDISITSDGQCVRIDKTEGQQTYEGLLTLPFTVEEVPRHAQFDRVHGVLTLTLKVVPPPLPEGVPTAEELRKSLPGGEAGKEHQRQGSRRDEEAEKRERETEEVSIKPPEKEVHTRASPSAALESALAAPPTVEEEPSRHTARVQESAPTQQQPASERSATQPTVAPPPAADSPRTTPSRPEVAHIGDQDRVAAMMAQVQAARAAREAAAAAAEVGEAKEAPQTTQVSGDAPEVSAAAAAAPPNVAKSDDESRKREQGEEAIPFLHKAAPIPSPIHPAGGDGDVPIDATVADLHHRQHAWAAMVEAEMQVAKAREEAEMAKVAQAAQMQAAKARRKLAAEREQERLAQIAQSRRAAVPLANKYIFSID